MQYRFELVDIEKLHSHEAVDEGSISEVVAALKHETTLKEPILVDDEHYVILDGHHRVEALRLMGCRRVPAYLVDYDAPEIEVSLWPEASIDTITKADVIRMGLSDEVFPPKTSRHRVAVDLGPIAVTLESLM